MTWESARPAMPVAGAYPRRPTVFFDPDPMVGGADEMTRPSKRSTIITRQLRRRRLFVPTANSATGLSTGRGRRHVGLRPAESRRRALLPLYPDVGARTRLGRDLDRPALPAGEDIGKRRCWASSGQGQRPPQSGLSTGTDVLDSAGRQTVGYTGSCPAYRTRVVVSDYEGSLYCPSGGKTVQRRPKRRSAAVPDPPVAETDVEVTRSNRRRGDPRRTTIEYRTQVKPATSYLDPATAGQKKT